MELLQEGLVDLLKIVIESVLAIASVYATMFVANVTQKAKVELQKVKDEKAKELLNENLDRVDVLLRTNIIAMENTLKKELIKDVADGKIDKEEAKLLVDNVKKNVLNQLGNESLVVLNEGLNDLNGYIEARLEQILVEVKNSNAK